MKKDKLYDGAEFDVYGLNCYYLFVAIGKK